MGGEGQTLERNIMLYHKKVSDYTIFTLMITWSFLGTLMFKQCHFKTFLWRKVYKQTDRLVYGGPCCQSKQKNKQKKKNIEITKIKKIKIKKLKK